MITCLSSPFSSNDKKVRSQNRKDNGNLSRAAEQLAMANSAVSCVVKRLEEKLSGNLINRTTRRTTRRFCHADGVASAISLLSNYITDETLPLNSVYYSDKAVNLRLRVFLDFLVEELRG